MKNQIAIIAILLFLFTTLRFAQNKPSQGKVDTTNNKTNSTGSINGVAAAGDVINIKNPTGNSIITITDEGSNVGSITLPSGAAPSTTTNKLYNEGGTLKFNGAAIGSGSGATELNDLSDAKYDGSSLFLGENTGANDDGTANLNTAVGKNALSLNTSGIGNTATGFNALYSNTTGKHNSANGRRALYSNTTGSENTAIGNTALQLNTIGSANTAIGYQSLFSSTTSWNNTANGYQTLYSNTAGRENTANGYKALYSNTSGRYNTAIGESSLFSNTIAYRNTATGSRALFSNTEGQGNVANGADALQGNTLGNNNTAIGYSALFQNSIGTENTAIGTSSLYFNTTGSYNVVLGSEANMYNLEGSNNTIVGYKAGRGTADHNKSGNIFIGYQAGYHETGDNKLYINNDSSGLPLIYGDFSTNILTINGNLESGYNSTASGSNSVALGTNCTASGTQSIAMGTGSIAYGEAAIAGGIDAKANAQAIAFGNQVKASAANSTALGNFVETTGTGSLIIGDESVSTILTSSDVNTFTARFAGGYKFFTNSASPFVGAKLDAGANSWSVISDSTKKENFKLIDGNEILGKISQFKLTSWNYKTQDPTKFRHYGPMAQDFYSAFGNDGIGTVGNDTTIASADFAGINFIAVQALESRTKEQEANINKLEVRIQNLEKDNKKIRIQNAELKTVLIKNNTLEKEVEILKQALYKVITNQNKIELTGK